LRKLDDRHGGGALSLRYVTAELRNVIDLVEYASYDLPTGRRLFTVVADLAQLLGWLHFDSSRYGAAERYLLLSVGVCRALGAADRAANAIGMLAYVSAFAGHGPEAVRLSEAAAAECRTNDPILRARLLGREATAAAADGDLARFRRCADQAVELLERGRAREYPSFLYYLSPMQLAAEAGQGLVVLAERTATNRDRLLTEGIGMLADAVAGMTTPGAEGGPPYARSGLLHTTFLARVYLLRGQLAEAVEATRMTDRCEPMSPVAVYVGVGVSTLDIPGQSWAETQRTVESVVDVPGQCLAYLADGTMLSMERGRHGRLGQFFARVAHHGSPPVAPADSRTPSVWYWLELLHQVIAEAHRGPR
jgi:hypothetical protein